MTCCLVCLRGGAAVKTRELVLPSGAKAVLCQSCANDWRMIAEAERRSK